MAKQFLDGPQIAAHGQKVRGEAVPQGVRRRGVRQAEQPAQFLHLTLDDARPQRAAPEGLELFHAQGRIGLLSYSRESARSLASGIEAVNWGKISQIVASWVVSPLLGGAIAFVLMLSIRRLILNASHPFEAAKRWGPVYVFLVGFIISLVTMFKGLKHLKI